MEVSASKTFVSDKVEEFAKRILIRGREVTAFPTAAVWKTWGDPGQLAAVVRAEGRRGHVPVQGIPAAVGRLNRTIRRGTLG